MTDPNICLCLDAEFVEGDEIIELSIFTLQGHEAFHQRFKPRRYTRWDSSIHHITPSMVAECPPFEQSLPIIQQIVDDAQYILGFAVDNDTSHLARQGVKRLDTKHILELRDWFWLCHGLDAGIDLFQGVSLERVARELEVDFGSEGMHSASGDTRATLECFRILFSRLCQNHSLDAAHFSSVVNHFKSLYEPQRETYDRTHAEGYAFLIACDDGYSLRVRHEAPRPSSRLAASIHVADRKRADVELRALMARRPMVGKGVYKLTPKDIEQFKAYTNGFDSTEHALYNKLQKLSGRFNVTSLKRR